MTDKSPFCSLVYKICELRTETSLRLFKMVVSFNIHNHTLENSHNHTLENSHILNDIECQINEYRIKVNKMLENYSKDSVQTKELSDIIYDDDEIVFNTIRQELCNLHNTDILKANLWVERARLGHIDPI